MTGSDGFHDTSKPIAEKTPAANKADGECDDT